MTAYDSFVQPGDTYTDQNTRARGVAIGTSFFQHGCQRVTLQWLNVDGDLSEGSFDGPNLVNDSMKSEQWTLSSDIVLGDKYTDTLSGVVGTATVVSFFENACERVTLEWNKDGDVHEMTLDAPRLQSEQAEEPVATSRKGGPGYGSSHTPRQPTRR